MGCKRSVGLPSRREFCYARRVSPRNMDPTEFPLLDAEAYAEMRERWSPRAARRLARYGAAFTFTRIKRSAAVAGEKLSRTLSVVGVLISVVVVAALKAASSGLPAVSTR